MVHDRRADRPLRRTLAGYARHPNLAGGAGGRPGLRTQPGGRTAPARTSSSGPKLRAFNMQDTGGTRKTIAAGIAAVARCCRGERVRRETVSASHLTVGPAVRRIRRLLVDHRQPGAGRRDGPPGAPRRHRDPVGDARDLRRRAHAHAPRRRPKVGEADRAHRWWKDEYSVGRDVQINGVVSPGNQAGGLANIFEKSLGSSMKGGTGR
jgi:altronate hydrolase